MYVLEFLDKKKCIGYKICIQTCPEPNAVKLIVDSKKACVIKVR